MRWRVLAVGMLLATIAAAGATTGAEAGEGGGSTARQYVGGGNGPWVPVPPFSHVVCLPQPSPYDIGGVCGIELAADVQYMLVVNDRFVNAGVPIRFTVHSGPDPAETCQTGLNGSGEPMIFRTPARCEDPHFTGVVGPPATEGTVWLMRVSF